MTLFFNFILFLFLTEIKKYRLADFFNKFWDIYSKNPKKTITAEQYKAVNAIRTCRTEVLGTQSYVCQDCGEETLVYRSCKHRFCPTCSWKDTINWAKNIENKMLNLKHRHIIFSVPHALNPIIINNKKILLDLILRVTAETFKDWFLAKYNIKIGVISVLHTFGEKKNWHTHVHSIITWGGFDKKTQELEEIDNNYVDYKFITKKFRIKFENKLIEFYDDNLLKHNFNNRIEFMTFIKKINTNDWQIQIEKPIDKIDIIIRYIGRYSKRACLSERKITNIQGEYITISYKDYKDRDETNNPKQKELTLHYSDFFPRLLQHVPLKSFQMVRYYGIYANKKVIKKEYFNQTKEIKNEKSDYKNPTYCYNCNVEKILFYTIYDTRKRNERTEKFEEHKHKHIKIYNTTKLKSIA